MITFFSLWSDVIDAELPRVYTMHVTKRNNENNIMNVKYHQQDI